MSTSRRTPTAAGRGPLGRAFGSAKNQKSSDPQATDTPVAFASPLFAALGEGISADGGGWKYRCPVHDDTTPSLIVHLRRQVGEWRVVAHCKGCGANGVAVCEALGLDWWQALYVSSPPSWIPSEQDERPPYVEPLSEAKVLRYIDYLSESIQLLAYLHEHRGLDAETVRRYQVGWDDQRDRYVIPIRDASGTLVNLRRYLPDAPPGSPKMINSSGHGSPPRLFPSPSGKGPLVVCEGEWDCLLLNQHGIPSVTSTHGAGTWLDTWNQHFAGRHVAFLYDVGAEDQALQPATSLAAGVGRRCGPASVRVVRLPLPHKGDDVTDWFVTYRRSATELRQLINAAAPLGGQGRRRS